jgi:hypothetical protein
MIQTYAFLAAFLAQIVTVSVLHPAWFVRYLRAKAEVHMPDWDRAARTRFLSRYRAANFVLAVFGLGLFAWLFDQMRTPHWTIGSVTTPLRLYMIAQMLPLIFASLIGAWRKRKMLLRAAPDRKRTASLERRGLFDIVPPFTVVLAVLAYILFAGFIIAIQRHPVAGFSGYSVLRVITLVYAVNAFCAYWLLYRRRKWPLETRAYRMTVVAAQLRLLFYTSLAVTLFVSLTVALRLLHLLTWVPFAMSVYIVIGMVLSGMMLMSLRRRAEEDRRELESDPPPFGQGALLL